MSMDGLHYCTCFHLWLSLIPESHRSILVHFVAFCLVDCSPDIERLAGVVQDCILCIIQEFLPGVGDIKVSARKNLEHESSIVSRVELWGTLLISVLLLK